MGRNLSLLTLCLAVFLVMTGMGMAVSVLPDRFLSVAGSPRSAGLLASVFALGYVPCQLPAGRLADRRGFAPVLAAGCLLIAASAVLYAVAANPAAIYLGRFVQGAGEAPVWAAAPALLGRLYPEARGRAMGLYNASFHIGLVAGPGLGLPLALAAGFDPFWSFAGLSLTAVVLVRLFVREPEPRPTEAHGSATRPDSSRGLWVVAAGLPLFGAVYGVVVSCLPVYLISAAGFTPGEVRSYFLFTYLGIGVAQLIGGELSDRLGRPGLMVAGLVLLVCGLTLFTSAPAGLFTAVVGVLGLGLGLFSIASLAFLCELAPAGRTGAVSGLYYAAWGGGYFLGPVAVDLVGVDTGMTQLAVYALLVAVMIMVRLLATPKAAR